jgi:L,D-peptidoglycan transpeptidase YkuD (ErfK/YbiS/YcfS/YnhG family)
VTKRPKLSQKPGKALARIVVRSAPRDQRRAILQAGPLVMPAAIGRSGRTSRKREGDGATPIASMPLLFAFYRGDRLSRPLTSLRVHPIRADMLWCDAEGHANYNRPVRAPFSLSHERLQREDELYDLCIVMDWNLRMRKRRCGSAIFFHLARPGFTPTEGCVAIRRRDMSRLLPHLGRHTILQVL